MEYDIVIPSAGERDNCILSVCKHSTDARVIVVANSTGLGNPVFSEEIPIEWILCPPKIGFTRAANIGLAYATAPFVVLLNDDTKVQTPKWLVKLSEPMRKYPQIAAVGPRTDASCFQGRIGNGPFHLCDKIGKDWRKSTQSWFCVMLRREALLDVGFLDKRFDAGYGGMEEDWIIRAEEKGWRVGIEPRVLVKHQSGAVYGKDRAELQIPNQAVLEDKWG